MQQACLAAPLVSIAPAWRRALECISVQTVELSHIRVPPENEGVRAALAELDQKVAAWASAVIAAQEQAVGWALPASSSACGENAGATRPRSPRPAIRTSPIQPEKTASPGHDEHAELEAKLKGLDPDIATAVRVQWRLLNGRVEVGELIRRCEATPPHVSGSGRQSWWKRVTG